MDMGSEKVDLPVLCAKYQCLSSMYPPIPLYNAEYSFEQTLCKQSLLTAPYDCVDLTIVDALNLGDKLQSILYYHFLPQEYFASQLAHLGSTNTDLGISTGTPYNVTFGQSATGQVSLRPLL